MSRSKIEHHQYCRCSYKYPLQPVWMGFNYNLDFHLFWVDIPLSLMIYSVFFLHSAFFCHLHPFITFFLNWCLLSPFCVDPALMNFLNSCLSYIFFIILGNKHIVFHCKCNNIETITVSYSSFFVFLPCLGAHAVFNHERMSHWEKSWEKKERLKESDKRKGVRIKK